MNARPTEFRTLPAPVILATALAVAIVLSLVIVADSEARMPMPAQNQNNVTYTCEVPVDAAESVRVAFAEYYECVDPIVDEWLDQYPEQVSLLAEQYEVWKKSRDHDLRDRSDAARFVRNNPVDFQSREISLSERQVSAMAPNFSSNPAHIKGAFQRFFVDRDAARLFLTSDEEGLVSLDISQRFGFEVEGTMDSAGGRDFFVVDGRTALMEEDNPSKSARDLVVLDISDRADPQEIHRLSGVLPKVSRPALTGSNLPDRAPTFDEYRMIRRGQFSTTSCGRPPTVSTHAGQFCRPDGSCFREERRSTPGEAGYCERNATPMVQQRPVPPHHGRAGVPRARRAQPAAPEPMMDMEMGIAEEMPGEILIGDAGRGADDDQPAARASAGGSGGAGSLSQMMIHGQTLFVLSADEGLSNGWLTSFDISNPRHPKLMHLIGLDNGPEALQRHDDLLLVAGRDALVTASAAAHDGPRLLGERRQNCPVNFDPVVVDGSIAYRTIIVDQPFSTCRSRLEVIDLSQPHQPKLRTTEAIDRPRGLAVLGHRLFVADENRGVRVFDITDPVSPVHTTTWKLRGVKDLVISDFDLYAMTADQIETYYVAPLYGEATGADDAIEGHTTVLRIDR